MELGVLYLLGEAVSKYVAKAIEQIESAHEQGEIGAALHLGSIYDLFEGFHDPQKAYAYYEMASRQGLAIADINMAKMLFNGDLGNRDSEKAQEILEPLVQAGDPEAQTLLATVLMFNQEPLQIPARSINLFRLAASQGNKRALSVLEILGVPLEPTEQSGQ